MRPIRTRCSARRPGCRPPVRLAGSSGAEASPHREEACPGGLTASRAARNALGLHKGHLRLNRRGDQKEWRDAQQQATKARRDHTPKSKLTHGHTPQADGSAWISTFAPCGKRLTRPPGAFPLRHTDHRTTRMLRPRKLTSRSKHQRRKEKYHASPQKAIAAPGQRHSIGVFQRPRLPGLGSFRSDAKCVDGVSFPLHGGLRRDRLQVRNDSHLFA
jgi:hypothetical protein